MERVLTELTPECEITAQMYAVGYEKKEIASIKCRALSTINNQLQTAMRILHVRNGRELAKKLYERMSGVSFTMDFSPSLRATVACCLLCLFFVDMHLEQQDFKRSRRSARTETVYRTRIRRLET